MDVRQAQQDTTTTTAEATRRQLVAYDLLELLIGKLGIDDVTHVLRYWYVVTSLDDKRRGRAERRARQNGK